MKEILNIKSEYIHVDTSQGSTYGGNQQFYKERPDRISRGKYGGGCGVVALGDLLLYLTNGHEREQRKDCRFIRNACLERTRRYFRQRKGDNRKKISDNGQFLLNGIPASKGFADQAQYMAYFDRLCKRIAWYPTKNGMSGIILAVRFGWLMYRAGLPYRAVWGFSEKKREARIKRMLVRDIPVILCIPKIFVNRKKNGLPLYVCEQNRMKPAVRTSAHYVVITGLVEEKGKLYYRISSWGKLYYISEDEFRSFVRKHILGRLFGTILWIPE